MRLFTSAVAVVLLLSTTAHATAPTGAFVSGQYRNLFGEYLGKTDAEIQSRLSGTWQQFVAGDPDRQRLFYPIAGDMAYVADVANNDVRSEGLSYLMMIAVQLDHQREFDQVWKFAKHYMYHADGPFRGYFAWHTAFDGRQLSAGPAPDGEEWFTMALFFAAHRWGSREGIFNYEAEAQALLRAMLHKHDDPNRGPVQDMFDRGMKQVNFVPHGPGAGFTDPSYHLPAFYELWARWADDPADRAFLAELAPASRAFFRQAAHPVTGLMSEYADFDGRPRRVPWSASDEFRYDAWRTLSNPALDHSWWAADPWEVEQANRVLRFLGSQGPRCPDRFTVDGRAVSQDYNSPGLVAMAATAALAADREVGEPWVRQFWEQPIPDGRYRYYGGLLTLLGLLEVSGNFRIYGPNSNPGTAP